MKPKNYPGRLGQPKRFHPNNAIAALVFGSEADLLDDLCRYYGIGLTAKYRWRDLALHLALNHVPAFQFTAAKKVGRPRKRRPISNVEKHGVGRPRTPDDYHKDLLEMVNKAIRNNKLSGRGKVKKAFEIELTKLAKSEGSSPAMWVPRMVKIGQKQFSRAKKLFPEIAAKF